MDVVSQIIGTSLTVCSVMISIKQFVAEAEKEEKKH